MKKLIVLVMSLAMMAAYAFAEDSIALRVNGDNGTAGDSKYIDDPEEPENDNPRCPSCQSLVLCGTPTETEQNGPCWNYDATALSCGSIIYGKVCDDNSDYFLVTVPGYTSIVVTLFDSTDCGRTPARNVQMKPYNSDCTPASDTYVHGTIEYTNEGFEEFNFIVRLKRDNNENEKYALVVACETINIPCPNGYHNYCEDPIVIPAGEFDGYYYNYYDEENTCCATAPVACVYRDFCGDTVCYTAGPSAVYEMVLEQETTLDIEVGVYSGGDVQFMVFTDCTNPGESCVASQDTDNPTTAHPEIMTGLVLPAGTYYISASYYNTGNCGDLYIKVRGDHELPIELTSFDAIAGDGAVTLNWATASENNNDYFEVLRNGAVMGRIEAANSVTGHTYSWTDFNLTNGREYSYNLVAVSMNGTRETVGTVSAAPAMNEATVTEYALHQNYPNPFNPETNITFDLVNASDVTLTVFNPLGQTIATLVNGTMVSGRHTVTFDGSQYTSGLYYYRLEAGDFTAIRKMVLMK